jgi:hypothetical protein
MRRMPWFACLWPGLYQLWLAGSWAGLVLAAGFALLLNTLLLASFVWVELLGVRDLRLGWLAVGLLWSGSLLFSLGAAARGPRPVSRAVEGLFRQALNEYLLGNWFEVESTLAGLLRQAPRDVEGRLLLATMLRRTGRHDEALAHLSQLERLNNAAPWSREIALERDGIARQANNGSEEVPDDDSGELSAGDAGADDSGTGDPGSGPVVLRIPRQAA